MSLDKLKRIYRRTIPEPTRVRFHDLRQDIRPGILSTFYNLIDKNVNNKAARLQQFHGKYNGQRCFIMGNGPSLNKMDLSLLQNEYVWGSNRCYLLFNKISWRPKFYMAVDTRVVPDNADEINSLYKKMIDSRFFFPVDFRYKGILKSARNVYWYKEIPFTEENLPYSMFCTNPSDYVYSVRTVTIAMLQIAVYMGFNPIYLIGCDTSYTIPNSAQFETGNNETLISTDEDPNHFDSSYFGKGKKWHEPHVDRMIFHYEQAKRVCDERGVRVINATVGGNLEVFPRINYLELF